MSVICTHNAGFFSCCSIRLDNIVRYINANSKFPESVDSSTQFNWYKKNTNLSDDITYEYFEHYDNIQENNIYSENDYNGDSQWIVYSQLDYKKLTPIINKYFSPSTRILNIIEDIKTKYNLKYDNICVLFYRGNDKITETNLSNYDDYLIYANSVLEKDPNILFLIQSDETEFIEFMSAKFPNNSFYFNDEIRHMRRCINTVDRVMQNTNYEFSKYYLAITIIMSKCKYVICGSGNCSLWIMLYRGNCDNTYQHLHYSWHCHVRPNI